MRRIAPLVAIALLAGCGGHGGGSSVSAGKGKGRGVIKITWPTRAGRLIPKASNSIVVSLTLAGSTTPVSKTVARPTDGSETTTTTFSGLAYGTYTVNLAAFPTVDASGVAQGRGAGSMVVTEDAPGAATVSLVSTVATLSLVSTANATANSADLAANVAGSTGTNPTLNLSLSAKDAQGQLVLLDLSDLSATDQRLTFTSSNARVATVVGNTTAASLDANLNLSATVTGLAGGAATITANFKTTDAGTLVTSAPFTVNVIDPRLAGSFARLHGDAGGTGQSSTAATGGSANVRSFTVGSGTPVSAIVTDLAGNVYASAGNTVKAFAPDGTVLWTQAVDGGYNGTGSNIFVSALTLTATRIYVSGRKLSALDLKTGQLVYTVSTAAGTANGFNDSNILSDGTIVATANAGVNGDTTTVYGISPTTHLPIWTRALDFRVANAPVITSDNVVVVSNGARIVGLRGATGTQVFNRIAAGATAESFSVPAASATSVFFVSRTTTTTTSTDPNGTVTSTTTSRDFLTTLNSSGAVTASTLVFTGTPDATPVYSGIGYLAALGTAPARVILTGTATQAAETGTLAGVNLTTNPTVYSNSDLNVRALQAVSFLTSGRAYLVSTRNTLVAVNAADGTADNGFTPVTLTNPTPMSPVISSDGTVYVASTTGSFYAVK